MNEEIKSLANGDFEVLPIKKEQEEALQRLADLSQEMEKAKQEYERKNDEWWNNLSYDERCDAFYAVVKRIYEGEVKVNGTYRYVLYNVFGFGPDMYMRGMDCGFMALHNSIMDEEQYNEIYRNKP